MTRGNFVRLEAASGLGRQAGPMRSRNLKPSFFSNEALAQLDPLARILFQGLWCMADRRGRLDDRPLRIKALALPYDQCDVQAMLNSLAKAGFIERYEVGDERYIQVRAFEKHQHPHHREPDSTIPPPTRCAKSPGEAGTSPGKSRPSLGLAQGEALPEHGLARLIPDSCNLIPEVHSANPPPAGATCAFENLWELYPIRKGRKLAKRSFEATVKTPEDWTNIQTALRNYLQSHTVKRGFIQNGSTWFNNWTDWIRPTPEMLHGTNSEPEKEVASWMRQ